MPAKRPDPTSTSDRRTSDREELEAPVRMSLEMEHVSGLSDNLSPAGLLFFTREPIRVRVELAQEEGAPRTYRGRLIRVQQMNEDTTGLAVEFDED